MGGRSHPERTTESWGTSRALDQRESDHDPGEDLGQQHAARSLWLGAAGLAVFSVGVIGIAKVLPGATGATSRSLLALMALFPLLPIGFSLLSRSRSRRSGHGWARCGVAGLALGLVALIPAVIIWAYVILHDNSA